MKLSQQGAIEMWTYNLSVNEWEKLNNVPMRGPQALSLIKKNSQ